MISQRLIAKIGSINKLQRILRWRTQSPSAPLSLHTSKGRNQNVISGKVGRKRKLHNLFAALNHGDFEWQDPKSDDEM